MSTAKRNMAPYHNIVSECVRLATNKADDYAGEIDPIELAGIEGVGLRLLEKSARTYNLTRQGRAASVKKETVRDNLLDIVNHAIFGILLLDNNWQQFSVARLQVVLRDKKEEPRGSIEGDS